MPDPTATARRADFHFDPSAAGFDVDPWPTYAYMQEHEPAFWWEEKQAWILTRHEDVVMTLRDPRFSVEFRYYGPDHLPDEQLTAHQLLTRYGMFWMSLEDHNHVRGAVASLFRANAVAEYRQQVQRVVDDILDGTAERGELDVVEDFVLGYPAKAITALLGIPGEQHDDFLRFASSVLDAFYPSIDAAAYDEKMSYLPHGVALVEGLIEQDRANPRGGLLSALIAARRGGRGLSPRQLLGMVGVIISAGSEPTRHLVSFTIYNLLRHPDQLAVLRAQPDLLGNAVNEVGRYDSMGKLNFPRFPLEDIELHGVTLRKGCPVFGVFASAQRDPGVFPDPGRFDIRRDQRGSLLWSTGLHNCLGHSLAQMIVEVAVETFLRRFPDASLLGDPVYTRDTFFRKMVSLPVSLKG
ncbi:cytochrome P450 [Saccharothrix obliqua]|uniref:cytochrome P450 n=1 Tax=Saccharothrix obliqua TaxID=2861747 RepID=UPI001C5DF028|nr:cytochrome P450 [Saccharothrix obliqua]MBW4720426.1 cytochrome P450 [Saccharothrix obliqua]